ncbi:MAG: hypothetical protein ACYC7E_13765 [Armatimonadota bacterium]
MYREKAQALLGEKQLIFTFSTNTGDLESYRRFAELAAEFGGTHMSLGTLPFKYQWALPDNTDPYPNWSITGFSLFRVFTPPAMQTLLPQEQADEWKALLAARAAILREYGLNATVEGGEPFWLPEAIYRAHPRWRGAQVELGRIAGKPYFSPSIDDPEVLEMYRWSMAELCRHIPELEVFAFWTNDSGSGLPWSVHTYPGMNGPMKYRQRNPGERVVGWMRAMRQGAADAGIKATIQLHSFTFTPADTGAIRPLLGRDLYLNSVNGEGEGIHAAWASLATSIFADPFHPVLGLADPIAFADGLQQVYQPGAGRANITMDEAHMPLGRMLLESFLDEPGTGALQRTRTLLQTGARFAGDAHAETLLKVWEGLAVAGQTVRQIRQRGASSTLPMFWTTERWLTRPLVPKPLELTAEEMAHYRDYLFTVDPVRDNANLCYMLGKPVFNGDSVIWMARWCLHEAIGRLKGVRALLQPIIAQSAPEAAARVNAYAARVGVAVCLLENARWTMMYQHALNITDQPRWSANLTDFDDNCQWDQRALELRKIARAELDNITELIDLWQSTPEPLIASTEDKELESVFQYGPTLIDDLRRKMDIMLNHWHEYELLYPTHKVWEYEPASGDGSQS